MAKALMPYDWGRVSWEYEERKRWMNLPFPVEEYQERTRRTQAMMERHGLDVLLAHGIKAECSMVRYFSNFEDYYGGDTVVVIGREGEPALVTNSVMHGEPMHTGIQETWVRDVRPAASPRTVIGQEVYSIQDHMADLIRAAGAERGRIGICGYYSAGIRLWVKETFPEAEAVDAQKLVMEELRQFKSPREIDLMRSLARIADAGLMAAMEAARDGVTEHDVAAAAIHAMYKLGADSSPGTIAVSAGPRSGFKHVAPTDRIMRDGDLFFIDLSSRAKGYFCDNSRNKVIGTATAEQIRFMESNVRITEEVFKAMKPGVAIKDLAKIGIEVAREEGVEQWLYFRGHGIGTAVQDLPAFSPTQTRTLQAGQVFVFEPMLVRYEFGTACVEDMFAVHEDHVEKLSQAPWRFW